MKIKNIIVALTAAAMVTAIAVPAYADGVGVLVEVDPESTATATNEDPGLADDEFELAGDESVSNEDAGESDEGTEVDGSEVDNNNSLGVIPVPGNTEAETDDDKGSPETGVNNSVLPALIIMGAATVIATIAIPKKSK